MGTQEGSSCRANVFDVICKRTLKSIRSEKPIRAPLYSLLVIATTTWSYFAARDVKDAFVAFILITSAIFIGGPLLGEMDDSPDAVAPPWLMRLILSVLLSVIVVIAMAYSERRDISNCLTVFAGVGASFALGSLFGFIFGVPRVLQQDKSNVDVGDLHGYAPNTNLEQISDWLTKIVVGITLASFTELLKYFNKTVSDFQEEIDYSTPFLPGALLLSYAVFGFLIGYLWTRLRLLQDLSNADHRARRGPEYYEGLMNAYLYNAPPSGFEEVLRLSEQYHRKFKQSNARVELYTACAYGQKYKFLQESPNPPNSEELDLLRKCALQSIRTLLEIDISYYSLARGLWTPDGNGITDSDLQVFKDDPDFSELFRSKNPQQ